MGTQTLCAATLLSAAAWAQTVQPAPPSPPKPPLVDSPMTPRARSALRTIPARGTYLGVGVVDVDASRAGALKLKETRGAEVTVLNPQSPAAKAGIQVGDVILEYNGQPVEGGAELQRLVRETPTGRQVKIGLWRNGAPVAVTATVEEMGAYPVGPGGVMDRDYWPFDGGFNFPPVPSMPLDLPRMVTVFQISALGVVCESLEHNSQLGDFFGAKEGLLVRSVALNSPADKAGIKAGDVIVKAGDTRIATNRDMESALRASRSSGQLPITIVRGKHQTALTVTLASRPEHF